MKYLSLIFLSVILVGCSATRIQVDKEFWTKNKSDKIGIVITQRPKAGAYKVGSQGLLDMAINKAMSSTLEKFLNTFNINDFNAIKDTFKTKLNAAGFTNVKFLESDLNYDSLSDVKHAPKNISTKDFKAFKDKYDLDYLIVISLSKYGTIRSYYGFIPLGAPSAYFQTNGMMVNLSSNEYAWYREMKEDESIVKVDGDWDQEPDYPNLSKAIKSAIISSRKLLSDDFFNQTK